MRIAVIDLGTNTFILLIAERQNGNIVPIYQQEAFVKLGEGVDQYKILKQSAIERGLAQLAVFSEIAATHQVESLHAAGTSAFRDALNCSDFIGQAQERLGLRVDVLAGELEATYSLQGAISNKPDLPQPVYMLDIGGGSTELCGQLHNDNLHRFSIDVGSVRMTERYLRHDPPTTQELQQLRHAITQKWQQAAGKFDLRSATLLGVDGTVTTLAMMALGLEKYDSKQIDGTLLQHTTIAHLVEKLAETPLAIRQTFKGLAPQRADVIVAGTVILDQIMRLSHSRHIMVSDRGWRFGLAQKILTG
ncbi:Ppx/GppA family phosphatase [candidate division KSB1 bacterium]|nr:Ppx/GppA family phosphatase [candidate division KSB1 bacterium]